VGGRSRGRGRRGGPYGMEFVADIEYVTGWNSSLILRTL